MGIFYIRERIGGLERGAKISSLDIKELDETSLEHLFNFIEKNDLQSTQKKIYDKYKINYPVMKIVDMYFWEKGFEETIKGVTD